MDQVPVNKELLTWTVPANKKILTVAIPSNKELLTGTVHVNNSILKTKENRKCHALTFKCMTIHIMTFFT